MHRLVRRPSTWLLIALIAGALWFLVAAILALPPITLYGKVGVIVTPAEHLKWTEAWSHSSRRFRYAYWSWIWLAISLTLIAVAALPRVWRGMARHAKNVFRVTFSVFSICFAPATLALALGPLAVALCRPSQSNFIEQDMTVLGAAVLAGVFLVGFFALAGLAAYIVASMYPED